MAKTNPKVKLDELDKGLTGATPSAATLGTNPAFSKTELISHMVTKMAGMSHNDLTDWFNKSIEMIGDEGRLVGDNSGSNRASVDTKSSDASAEMASRGRAGSDTFGSQQTISGITWPVFREDLDTVLSSMGLNEENAEKARVLFENAIQVQVAAAVTDLEEQFESALDEAKEDLATAVDEYLAYAADQFVQENEIAIQSTIKADLVESFMAGLQKLFVEHYIEVPEDRVDVVEELGERVKELEDMLDVETAGRLEAEKEVQKIVALKAFNRFTEGMVDTDVEKFKVLSENVDFDGDVEDLEKKLKIIKEAHFGPGRKPAPKTGLLAEESVDTLNEGEGDDQPIVSDPAIKSYVAAISRTAKSA